MHAVRPGCSGFRCLTLFGCLLLSACSGGTKPITLHQVSGKLTINGSMAPNIVIHFDPEKGRPSTGVTDASGSFEMRYEKDRTGTIPGTHKVWIEYRPASPAEDMAIREGKGPLTPEVQEALKKYGSSTTTPYKVTVDKDDKNLLINLE